MISRPGTCVCHRCGRKEEREREREREKERKRKEGREKGRKRKRRHYTETVEIQRIIKTVMNKFMPPN